MVAMPATQRIEMHAMCSEDVEEIAAIEASAYDFPWTRGIFRDCLRSAYECWVLRDGDFTVGYGVLSIAAGEAHLLNACIAPAQQGNGYGRHLIRRMVEVARWHRAERIFLEVRPSNLYAVKLYDSLGFNEIAMRPKYYPALKGREDAMVMALELLPPD